MPATVTIRRWTGTTSGPTKTDITGINTRANAEDAHTTAGTVNPIQIPTSGTNYSFWVSTRLSADSAPAGTINNIRWYTDGANGLGTGVTCVGQEASSYGQASGTTATTGTQLTSAAYATGGGVLIGGAPSNVFTFTSASPRSITGSIVSSTGDIGNFWVYQIQVDSTANSGATPSETFTWRYDET